MDHLIEQKINVLSGQLNALEVTLFQHQTDLKIASASTGNAAADRELKGDAVWLETQIAKTSHKLNGLRAAIAELQAQAQASGSD